MLNRVFIVLAAFLCLAIVARVWSEVMTFVNTRTSWRRRFAAQHKFLLGKMEGWGDRFPAHLPAAIPPTLHVMAPPTAGGDVAAAAAAAAWTAARAQQHLDVRVWTAGEAVARALAAFQGTRVGEALRTALAETRVEEAGHMVRLMVAWAEGGWAVAPTVRPSNFPLRLAAYHRNVNRKIGAAFFSTRLQAWAEAQARRVHPVRCGAAELAGERVTPEVVGCTQGHGGVEAVLAFIAERVLTVSRPLRSLDSAAYRVSYVAGEDAVTTAVRTCTPPELAKVTRLAPYPTSALFFTHVDAA